MQTTEIVLPVTKPETEWVRGRPLQKVSPTRDHGRLQMKLAFLLDAWARGRGEVATEWRFRVAPPGEQRRPLVPDIAFATNEQLLGRTDSAIQSPAFAPALAIEILSPIDDPRDVASKVEVYLQSGTALVMVVGGEKRTITIADAGSQTVFRESETLSHLALPGFELAVGNYFAEALDRAT